MEEVGLKYLLDTAVWINGITMPEALPPRIRSLIASETTKGLCSVSLLETAILYRLGRLQFQGTLADLFSVGISADLRLIDLSPPIAAATNDLPQNTPGDPFDRAIVATAATLGLAVITADSAIRDAQACSVEYYPFKSPRSLKRRS